MGRAGRGSSGGSRSSGSRSSSRSSGSHTISRSSRAGSSSSSSGSRPSSSLGRSNHRTSTNVFINNTRRTISTGYGHTYQRDNIPNYGGKPTKGCLISIIGFALAVLFIIIAVIVIGTDVSSGTRSSYQRERLNLETSFDSNCIIDELGWFDNKSATGKKLKEFYDLTGVQPYIYLKEFDSTIVSDEDRENFVLEWYDNNINNEDTFLYVYFADRDQDDEVGGMAYIMGSNVSSMMDEEAVQIFWNKLDSNWYRDTSTDDLFIKVFNGTADVITSEPSSGWDVLRILAILLVVIITTYSIVHVIKVKRKSDREKADETERILNTPINSINSDTDDLVDKYK